MGYQACGHQRLQVAVSDSLMTQICLISIVDLQIAVSDSLMTQICVKSSLEGNEWLDTQVCQIKIRDCNFLILTHFCVILNPSMQFLWRLKNDLMAPPWYIRILRTTVKCMGNSRSVGGRLGLAWDGGR